MGSEVVPAQREAVRYLEETMKPNGRYRIGGHSKGGNLAIYSALHCKEELRRTILAVYNNDGPGLSADIVPPEQYERIGDRLHWIIPEYSVIGTLFPYGAVQNCGEYRERPAATRPVHLADRRGCFLREESIERILPFLRGYF